MTTLFYYPQMYLSLHISIDVSKFTDTIKQYLCDGAVYLFNHFDHYQIEQLNIRDNLENRLSLFSRIQEALWSDDYLLSIREIDEIISASITAIRCLVWDLFATISITFSYKPLVAKASLNETYGVIYL